MRAQLGEVIDEILRRKKWVQADLAKRIGVTQPAISKMRVSVDWNIHWQAFVGLLPLLNELQIDPAKSLHDSARKEASNDEEGIVGTLAEAAREHEKVQKRRTATRSTHPVPSRQLRGSKRKLK